MGERKKMILMAAIGLLERHGWGKTTVAAIAREAKVGTGTVYLEFRSKESIMHALSTQRFDTILRAMRRAAMRQGSWSDRFKAVMNARATMFIKLGAHSEHAGQLLHCGHPSVQSARQAFETDQRELLADLIAAAIEEGSVAQADPDQLAHTLLVAYSAFSPPNILKNSPEASLNQIERLHDITLNGLLSRPD